VAEPKQPHWLAQLIGIVEPLCRPDSDAAASKTNDKRIGAVISDAERPAGWFRLGLRGRKLDSDQLDGGYLAPAKGEQRYQLIEALQEGNILRVRVAEHAPPNGLFLWVPGHPPGFLEKSLLDGLASIDRFDLINRFAAGIPDPVPPRREGWQAHGLNDEQGHAWTACTTPGVHLVWGPPGTGKTQVITAALRTLIADGKSVLLVSGTNVAVDNALERAARTIDPPPAPGVMVRVGTPHLPAILDNPAVCLDALIRDRQTALEQKRLAVHERIAELKSDPVLARLDSVRAEVAQFHAAEYKAAAARIADARRLAQAKADLEALEGQEATQAETISRLRGKAERLASAWSATESARGEFEWIRALRPVQALKWERDNRVAELTAARAQRRFGHRDLKDRLKDAEDRLVRAANALGYTDVTTVIRDPDALIRWHQQRAAPHTEASVQRLVADFTEAETTAKRAAEKLKDIQRKANEQASRISTASQQPTATGADYELVAWADQNDLPGKLADLTRQEHQAADILRKIGELEKEHERILGQMRTDAAQVRREIITRANVVAATLAKARLQPAIRERDYDYVIVDEAAFACIPEVVCAASHATKGVALLGDFLQNAPIPPDAYKREKCHDPLAGRWYQQDCYASFGIKDPASARRSTGCVTLVQQHRFGEVINDLANAVAYDGILQVAPNDARPVPRQEVTLVDVDDLGVELAGVRRVPGEGRWWPVGELLARTLAERDGAAGIVTPYKLQFELIENLLAASDSDPRIDVGTSHRFQGREFDTVIFDLVEDGTGPLDSRSWVARATLNGSAWEAGGVRVFNVGITRTKKRLYVIASGKAVETALEGPLRALDRLVGEGRVRKVRAREILRLAEPPANDPVVSEIWQALHDHATVVNLYDEDTLPDELRQRLDEAKERIWLWSPWVGRRSEEMLPHLRAAQDRGVRVHVVALPRRGVTGALKPRHEDLAAQIDKTIYLQNEHQKLIVIDDLTFIGSMNVLAHVAGAGRRLEVMALFRSEPFANRVLEQERTDELAFPPTCPNCKTRVVHVKKKDDRLHWVCRTPDDKPGCGWSQIFSDRPKTRNQPRRGTR
jgi:hypothetical protein